MIFFSGELLVSGRVSSKISVKPNPSFYSSGRRAVKLLESAVKLPALSYATGIDWTGFTQKFLPYKKWCFFSGDSQFLSLKFKTSLWTGWCFFLPTRLINMRKSNCRLPHFYITSPIWWNKKRHSRVHSAKPPASISPENNRKLTYRLKTAGWKTYLFSSFKGGPFVRVVLRSFGGYGNLSSPSRRASSASLTAKKVWALGSTATLQGSRIQAPHQTGKVEHHHSKGPFFKGIY